MSEQMGGYVESPIVPEEVPEKASEKSLKDAKTLAAKARDELNNIWRPEPKESTVAAISNPEPKESTATAISDPEYWIQENFNTTAISDFKYWLKNEALSSDATYLENKEKLKQAGFFKDDEKSTFVTPEDNVVRAIDDKLSVTAAIDNIVSMLDELITNPTDFKMKYPSNLNMLIKLLEAYSE